MKEEVYKKYQVEIQTRRPETKEERRPDVRSLVGKAKPERIRKGAESLAMWRYQDKY